MDQPENSPKFTTPPTSLDPQTETHKSWFARHLLAEILGLVAAGAVLAGGYFYYVSTTDPVSTIPTPIHVEKDPMAGWKTYTSNEHNFELKYPSSWKVGDDVAAGEPRFSIYKTGDAPLSHHVNTTQISIFPKGLGTEGSVGTSKEIKVDLTAETENRIIEYSTENDGPFGYAITFAEPPATWESYGYVWGAAVINNKTDKTGECPEPCGLPPITVSGEVNKADLMVVKQILSTFKFVESTAQVNSFAACAEAGNPIMESFPEQCRTPEGLTFVKPQGACIQVIAKAQNPKTGEVREFPTPCDIPVGWTEVRGTDSKILINVYSHGGLCVTGSECQSIFIINNDGSVYYNGASKLALTASERADLAQKVNSADYKAIQSVKFTGTCPTAYDGQQVEYTFYSNGGIYKIDSCVVAINPDSEPFKTVEQIIDKRN